MSIDRRGVVTMRGTAKAKGVRLRLEPTTSNGDILVEYVIPSGRISWKCVPIDSYVKRSHVPAECRN